MQPDTSGWEGHTGSPNCRPAAKAVSFHRPSAKIDRPLEEGPETALAASPSILSGGEVRKATSTEPAGQRHAGGVLAVALGAPS
jgi:hypothetical protein